MSLAIRGWGGDAVVYGNLAQSAITLLLLVRAAGTKEWLTPTRLRWERFRDMLRFGVPLAVQRVGSMLGLFFREGPAEDLAAVEASDRDLYARVFHGLLSRGVHLPPSPFETLFVSLAHGEAAVRILTKRPIEAGDEEIARNPRARSAKLRAIERLA